MYMIAAVGYAAYKGRILNDESRITMSNMSLYIVNPIVLLTQFQHSRTGEMDQKFAQALFLSFVAMVFGFIVSQVVFKKEESVEKLALGFSNSTYIGLPLVQSIMGSQYLYINAVYVLWYCMFFYSYGIYMISGDKRAISIRSMLANPGFIAPLLGFIMYLTPFRLPEMIKTTFSLIGNMNAPLAMMILGIYLANSDIIKLLKDRKHLFISFLKLIALPLLTLLVLKFVPGPADIKMVVLLLTACPSGMSISMAAALYGKDDRMAATLLTHTTALAIVTMPLMIYLGQIVLG